jgi:hypothetical protein
MKDIHEIHEMKDMYAMVSVDREIDIQLNISREDFYEYYDENGLIYSSQRYEIVLNDFYTSEHLPISPISIDLLCLEEDYNNNVFVEDGRQMILKHMVEIVNGDRKWDKWFHSNPQSRVSSYREAFSSIPLVSSMEKEVRDIFLKDVIEQLGAYHQYMYEDMYEDM